MSEWSGVRGKRVLITGATNGIGLAAAEALAKRGAELAVVARSQERAEAAVSRIRAAGGEQTVVDVLVADLASQASVRALAAEALERYPKLEVLVNNAGAVHARRQLTADGVEMTWAVNHLAPFLLTNLLLDRLRESAPARIVTTSSDAHAGARGGIPFDDLSGERSWAARGFRRYGESKLANILFTVELARRLEGTGVTANCFHPGFVASGFNHNNGALMRVGMNLARPFQRTPEKGAETLVWLVDSPELEGQSGGYFADRKRLTPSAAGRDAEAARRLWEVSEEQVRASAAAGD
ncbi:MAG: SDR family oxidoreductase [Candidatus Dormibacteraeota bacterium]|nr:SDR family oxidoreductase [Candidatus Dormibacteraeota bacterium]